MTSVLLSTTYFGPVQWYQKLYRYDSVSIDLQETFQKQTYRNRCLIATTQGVQALTVPVVHDASNAIGDIRISDHGNWRHLHWQALQTAYGDSPFFEYYEDDLRPFFTERHWERLKDYNMSICQKMCELLDIQPTIVQTSDFSHLAPHPSILMISVWASTPSIRLRMSIFNPNLIIRFISRNMVFCPTSAFWIFCLIWVRKASFIYR